MGATVVGKNLTKTYNLGDQMLYALNDVSLEVYPGEMVAIIGRTGSGKSTLLHTLGCLQRPDSGRVLLEDLDVTQLEDEELARVRLRKSALSSRHSICCPMKRRRLTWRSPFGTRECLLETAGVGCWMP